MKRIALVLCIVLLSLSVFAQGTPAEKSVTLTFIETSDIHGAIYPYDFVNAKPMATSLAQIASLIAEEKAANPNVVLLDNGDSLQGQPTVYYYNFEKTSVPHIWSQALNYLQFDAIGVGNHDIEAGHNVYDKLYEEVKASVLCANAVKPDGSPYFTPYTVIEKQGVKIAVLGMISPKVPDWLPPQFWTGMEFEDMVDCAKKWVPIIQEKEKPDLLVGLFHAGVDYTYGNVKKDTKFNENASQVVAEKVPGFDMIFVGHDHSGWDGMGWDPAAKKKVEVKDPNGKTVYIYGALNAARKTPVVNVSLDWNEATSSWDKRFRGGLVDIAQYKADPGFVAQFQAGFDDIKKWVDRPIGKMEGVISTRESMFEDSAFVDLIHRIQLDLSKDPAIGLAPADISFVAPLSGDAKIPTSADGTLYVRDMFNLYVYENFLYTMNMTGKQVQNFLEYSYKFWFDTMPNEGNHLINFQKDKDGKLVLDNRSNMPLTATRSYNYDSAAGVNYFVDVSKPAGERVVITSMSDGRAFNPDETYVVAINSYRGSGGGGHLTAGAGIDPTVVRTMKLVNGATTKDLRYFLLKWFEAQKETVRVAPIGNWFVVPEDLAAIGKANDYPLLYPKK
ncbi:MAG TPA: bifunctional UDP-sugar hydrolase/5'-nucleotidase [Rectinemataceae bacterium]|nr:bifunctional UDP-sugar hydrolase/5'-nucleotidase [Rectinemataceae bacterium]